MARVVIRGESVYECDVCNRRNRVPTNRQGLDVLPRCNITSGCRGSLHRVTAITDVNNTPAITPEVAGITDWFPRQVLYTHQQPIKSATWAVTHDLQNIPITHVFVTREVSGAQTLVPMEPSEVVVVDANTIKITFAEAESGQVQCVSLVSRNTVNYTTPTVAPSADVPVSSDTGEITIATLATDSLIDVQLTFALTPHQEIIYTGVDVVPSTESAWTGVNAVIINGRRYTVRSFNIKNGPAAQLIASGVIPSGTTFFVSGVNGLPPLPNEVLFLLSTPPHAYADREYDRYIDSTHISSATPEMYYASGTAATAPTVVKTTYPLILVV